MLFDQFVKYRVESGVWNKGYEQNLLYFDRYCTANNPNIDGITQDMIDGWCQQRDTETKTSLIERTLPARKLVEYLNKRDILDLKIPDMPSLPPKQYIPHFFTKEELSRFFAECDMRVLRANDIFKKFRALEMSVFFRLLYSSGMRTTEARLLSVSDVDLSQGVIGIKKTKNSIEHYVALHSTTTEMLIKYNFKAQEVYPNRTLFFPRDSSKGFSADIITYEFHKVWDKVNPENAIPYDLRHNYAIENINSWLSLGFDFNDKLVYLSKSMGHTSLDSTRYYYSIVPSLANIIEKKSGESFDDIVPEVPNYEF